jgi:hypothetical protein
MLKQGPRFFRAPGPVAGAGSEALRFATSPAPAIEPGALRLMPFALTPERQAHGCSIWMSPMETLADRVTLNAATRAGACGGAMWQSEAPLSPAAGLWLSGGLSPAAGPCLIGEQTPLSAKLIPTPI